MYKVILLLFWVGIGVNKTKLAGLKFSDPPNPLLGGPVPPGPGNELRAISLLLDKPETHVWGRF